MSGKHHHAAPFTPEVKVFQARNDGVCAICGAAYHIDDDVARIDEQVVHAECAWALEADE